MLSYRERDIEDTTSNFSIWKYLYETTRNFFRCNIFVPNEICNTYVDFNSNLQLDKIFPKSYIEPFFSCSTKEIWNEILIRVYTNKTHKYKIVIPNKLLQLQIDSWSTCSIDFFLFILMPGYFTKIKMLYLKTDFW